MADAADLKSATFAGVWVRVPLPAPIFLARRGLDRLVAVCLLTVRPRWQRTPRDGEVKESKDREW